MILHLANDNSFVDFSIKEFEKQYPNKNRFLIIVKNPKNYRLKNITNSKAVNVVSIKDLLNEKNASLYKNAELVVIHFLDKEKARFVSKLSQHRKIKILWIAWGWDFYHYHPVLKKKLLLKKTEQIKDKIERKNIILLSARIGLPILKFFGLYRDAYWYQKKAVPHIQYVATIIYDDYEIIRKYYNANHLKYVPFSYGNLEDKIAVKLENKKPGKNILIGNSSSYTNNHAEIFDLISQIKTDGKIIVPLSYGDTAYRDEIIKYGKKKLGERFAPLTEFLPLEEYYRQLQSCGFFIGNYTRQQAMGNIHTMMFLGAKIFLRKENPAYNFLIREGACVFDIDEIESKKETAFEPLTEEQIEMNREYLKKHKSRTVVEKFHKDIVALAED